jgi:hypothetical protein
MLAFIDLPKHVRIVRIEPKGDGVERTILGRISKNNLELDHELESQLNLDERKEVEQIVAGYLDSDIARKKYYALNIPVILREVMEYFEDGAEGVEKTFILGAMMEAVRRMRKIERAGSG